MARFRTPVLAVLLALTLAGCASGPIHDALAQPPRGDERFNGQPKLLPCMRGDDLC